MKIFQGGLLAAALVAPAVGLAHGPGHDHGAMPPAQQAAPAGMDGEVRHVDREGGRITIYHDEVPSMGMPAMTMVLAVKDAALLERARAGDKVRFRAERTPGELVLRELELRP